MFRAWYVPFYFYGVIHGDPHLGNYTVRPDNGINLLDSAACGSFKPSFVKGVIDLYFALQARRPRARRPAYEIWGFKKSVEGDDRGAEPMARFVYAPLLDDRSRKIQEKDSGIYGRDVARRCTARCAASAACGRRASSSSWTAPPSASARCSSISRPRSTGTACSTS